MNTNASPGPDGFGPIFFRKYWNDIKQPILTFFTAFHDQTASLERFNRAYMVLLPKSQAPTTPDAFRPISLQNCMPKAVAKVLTNRVKLLIPLLIHYDQTGFLHGRNIAENFIYAADILSACHSRKAPTMIFKLDFRKAFDSICWSSLIQILQARGFPSDFCSWVQNILLTGKTAILLNGVPGSWIQCRCGLRQGDPFSPYLFIIVADVLQRLIAKAFQTNVLCHPLRPNEPPVTLQYADDTLIIAAASDAATIILKNTLHDFALATGLVINFQKTALLTIATDSSTQNSIAIAIGCSLSSFPLVYLGLPLSPTKLPLTAFDPIIDSFRKFLFGWVARLLSRGARLTLLTAVLDSLTVYFMSVFHLPKSIIAKLDAIRRAFFWSNEPTCTGASCLVVWKNVCKPKDTDGLGIKNLEVQNRCLLMKFSSKILQHPNIPWTQWYHHQYPLGIAAKTSKPSFLWKIINNNLPLLIEHSFVLTYNGLSTFFWLDKWLLQSPLQNVFPNLFSYSIDDKVLVATVWQTSLLANLRNRLSNAAARELDCVLLLLQDFQQTDQPDERSLTHGLPFSAKNAYSSITAEDDTDPHHDFVWSSKVPIKVKIFAWLLLRDRLNTKANMFHKHIAQSVRAVKTLMKMHSTSSPNCSYATQVWSSLGLPAPTSLAALLQHPTLHGLNPNIWPSVVRTISWKLWDSRNALVFRNDDHTHRTTIRNIVADFSLWVFRFKKKEDNISARQWLHFLSSAVP